MFRVEDHIQIFSHLVEILAQTSLGFEVESCQIHCTVVSVSDPCVLGNHLEALSYFKVRICSEKELTATSQLAFERFDT
jgi:hypothetical protein